MKSPNAYGRTFSDSELRYSATFRCPCGAGIAYPPDGRPVESVFNMPDRWECADILTGRSKPDDGKVYGGPWFFSYFKVNSEDQPSANGATTRPSDGRK